MTQADRISRVIFEYAARIGGAQDTGALLQLNADMARDLAGADRCSIWLVDATAREIWTKVAHGTSTLRIPLSHGLVGACIDSNESIVVNDTSSDPRFLGRVDEKSGYATQSVLVLPLRGADGRVIGALQALNKPGGFDQSDVDLLSLAASYSASALEGQQLRAEAEQVRLLLKELEIARSVQQRLLPQKLPALPGLEFQAYCRPAKFVGGDYYDFVDLPGERLFFTLGDVSGKGIAAAVLMASIQAAIRSQMLHPPEALSDLVNDFNKAVYSFSTSDKYSTLFCAHLDPSSRRMTFVNAGGCPPMLLRAATGRVERLDAGGCPVGLLGFSRYQQAEVQLESGDVLLCFSDGISEATNAAEAIWEESELEQILRGVGSASVQAIVESVVAAADAFTGDAEQADDMTVVVMKAL
ncbi:SpoIIE family protein phosphatase [uncultured Paludibaculum sp.]|uniref:PP2C family protein-serine/threonine phosphatase n=1 Tax=uncultured Paludibaculum sp. TaxID=1765020 RepID=UPI002AAB8C2E|nr:SpoIIE family protein phosphatase [uncultured Paludibaculum sp.]